MANTCEANRKLEAMITVVTNVKSKSKDRSQVRTISSSLLLLLKYLSNETEAKIYNLNTAHHDVSQRVVKANKNCYFQVDLATHTIQHDSSS